MWQQTSSQNRLKVYIVAVDMSSTALLSYLGCHQIPSHLVSPHCSAVQCLCQPLQIEVVELSSSAVSSLRRVVDPPDLVGNLASAANFARFLLPDLLPHLSHGLFFDTDSVVLGDVAELWSYLLSSSKMMVAVPRSLHSCHSTWQTSLHINTQVLCPLWRALHRHSQRSLPEEVSEQPSLVR